MGTRVGRASAARGTLSWPLFAAWLAAALFCLVLLVPGSAGAATIVVSSAADAGSGSLREAIEEANRGPGADRIELGADLGGEIRLRSPLPEVTAPLHLVGPGADRLAISGGGTTAILDAEVGDGGEVRIEDVTLRDGSAADGGAIVAFATKLVLVRVDLEGNRATNAGGAISLTGGGLTLIKSRLSANSASYPGGGAQVTGAALRVSGSEVRGNSAGSSGGGIYVSEPAGRTSIEDSTIADNGAGGDGGGIALSDSAYGTIEIGGSKFSGNRAEGSGDDVFPPHELRSGDAGGGSSLPPASAGSNGTTTAATAASGLGATISAPLEASGSQSTAMLLSGIALAPPDAPPAIKATIAAANMISDTPYLWGGGHASWYSPGYDCSGAVSFALRGGGFLSIPLTSGQLANWGAPGPGRWITLYANAGHVYAVIAGLRWDTVGDARGSGPRWHVDGPYPPGFAVRHPPGY